MEVEAVHAELMVERPPDAWSVLIEHSAITSKQFGERLRRSRLVSRDEIQNAWDSLDKDHRSPLGLARSLVSQRKVTESQLRILIEDDSTPLVLGDYVIVDRVGEGGMGRVYRALHRKMQREVALKVISPQLVKNETSIRRFNREVQAAARLSHPNIVTAYDAGEESGSRYLVMEYVVGSDLASLVRRTGPLSIDDSLNYTRQAAVGLAYAHERGIVHRDVKPTNLLLDENGNVKILDMGLARLDQERNESGTKSLTETGVLMGTINYMSPEQAVDSKTADARSDIYSLGCTWFYLLFARPVFEADTSVKQILAHRDAEIPRLSELLGEPEAQDVDAVFQRMLAKSPSDRYQTIAELLDDLELLASHYVNITTPGDMHRKSANKAQEDPAIVSTAADGTAELDTQTDIQQVASTTVRNTRSPLGYLRTRCSTLRTKSNLILLAVILTTVCILIIVDQRGSNDAVPLVTADEAYLQTRVSSLENAVHSGRETIDDLKAQVLTEARRIVGPEAELARFEQQFDETIDRLTKTVSDMTRFRMDLESANAFFTYGGRTYTRDQVVQDLANRFQRYNTRMNAAKTLESMVSQKRSSVSSSRERIKYLLSTKRHLEVLVSSGDLILHAASLLKPDEDDIFVPMKEMKSIETKINSERNELAEWKPASRSTKVPKPLQSADTKKELRKIELFLSSVDEGKDSDTGSID